MGGLVVAQVFGGVFGLNMLYVVVLWRFCKESVVVLLGVLLSALW